MQSDEKLIIEQKLEKLNELSRKYKDVVSDILHTNCTGIPCPDCPIKSLCIIIRDGLHGKI